MNSPPVASGAGYRSALPALSSTWVLVGLLVLQGLVLWPYRNFAGDDAYITFQFVRNVMAGEGFAFNAGEPVYGSTAPLWVLAIAAVAALGLAIPDAAHLLNALFAAVNVALFWKLGLRYLGPGWLPVMASVLFVLDPWQVKWSLSGMENALVLTLLMASLLTQLALREAGRVNLVTPVLAGLAVLCRPEMVLWAGLLGLDVLLNEKRHRRANFLALITLGPAFLVPWLWYAQDQFGSIIPNTIAAKLSRDHLRTLDGVVAYFGSFWAFQGLAVIAVLLVWPRQWMHRSVAAAGSAGAWFLPLAWSLILPLFYIVGGAQAGGRYLVFGLPFYLLIGLSAWGLLLTRYPMLVRTLFVASLLLIGYVQYRYAWHVTDWPEGMDPNMIEMARTLQRVAKPGEVVAGDQIGVVGYVSGLRVLDVWGLVSSDALAHRKTSQDPQASKKYPIQRRVQYLFLADTREQLMAVDPAFSSIEVITSADVRREGAGGGDRPDHYHLYRTHW